MQVAIPVPSSPQFFDPRLPAFHFFLCFSLSRLRHAPFLEDDPIKVLISPLCIHNFGDVTVWHGARVALVVRSDFDCY